MAIELRQDKFDLLRQAYPGIYFEAEPFLTLAESHRYAHANEELRVLVERYGLKREKTRKRVLFWGVLLGGVGLTLFVSYLWMAIPFILYIPLSVLRQLRPHLTTYWGGVLAPHPITVILRALVAVAVPLLTGCVAFVAAAFIPTQYIGVPGLIGTVVAIFVYRKFFRHALMYIPPRPQELEEEDPPLGRKVEVIRGSSVARFEQMLPDALWSVTTNNRVDAEAPVVSLSTFDVFGGLPIRRGSTSNNHTLFIGMPGSGKTVFLRVLMGTILPEAKGATAQSHATLLRRKSRSNTSQAIIYDAKTEHVPVLVGHGFKPRRDLFILNPFDERCVVWDMAKDIRSPSDARLLAEVFLSANLKGEEREEHQYFRSNARKQIAGVIQTFIHRGERLPTWTLRDVINAFSSPQVLRHVLSHHPEGTTIIDQTIDVDDRTSSNIFTSSTTYLEDLRILASLWHRVGQEVPEEGECTSISLREWIRDMPNSVLLLPNTRENPTVITPLNKLILHRVAEMLLDRELNSHTEHGAGVQQRRVIMLDECPELGKIEKLPDLLAQGREYGVQVILGVQAVSQLNSAFGEEVAKTILGQCAYKALLKCDGNTAAWAAKEIGQQLERFSKMSYTTGQSGSHTTSNSYSYTRSSEGSSSTTGHSESFTDGWSTSETKSFDERLIDTVLASELSGLPDPKSSGCVGGYYITPHLPVFRSELTFVEIDKLVEGKGTVPAKMSVDSSHEWLPEWGDADYIRLGLTPFSSRSNGTPRKPEAPDTRVNPSTPYEDLF